jgi:hypothetical protein
LVDEIDERIRNQLEKSASILDSAAAQAERRLISAGITSLDTEHLTPLVLNVMVFSSYGKRYLQLIGTFDQTMLMLEATASHGLIGTEEMAQEKAQLKKDLQHFPNLVRDLRSPRCAGSGKSSELSINL